MSLPVTPLGRLLAVVDSPCHPVLPCYYGYYLPQSQRPRPREGTPGGADRKGRLRGGGGGWGVCGGGRQKEEAQREACAPPRGGTKRGPRHADDRRGLGGHPQGSPEA